MHAKNPTPLVTQHEEIWMLAQDCLTLIASPSPAGRAVAVKARAKTATMLTESCIVGTVEDEKLCRFWGSGFDALVLWTWFLISSSCLDFYTSISVKEKSRNSITPAEVWQTGPISPTHGRSIPPFLTQP